MALVSGRKTSSAIELAELRYRQFCDRIAVGLGSAEADACPFCDTLLQLADAPSEATVCTSPGNWEAYQKSLCQKHVKVFPPTLDGLKPSQEILLSKPMYQNLIYVFPQPLGASSSAALDAPWEPQTVLQLPGLLQSQEEPSLPRIIDPKWIDINLCTKWLTDCKTQHHGTCGSTGTSSIFMDRPNLLVDTHLQCVVRTEPSYEYVALSYVWGHVKPFRTLKATWLQLSEPGALAEHGFLEHLPKTIRQAIALTAALCERYLWVDALCFVQDSEDQSHELNAMASIFANATLTIVAAQGDNADVGFHGVPNICPPRQVKQEIVALDDCKRLFKPSSRQIWDDSLLRPWSERGWTFQEAICSRRILYFAHDSVRWKCRTAWWSEESHSADCMLTHATPQQQRASAGSPQITSSSAPQMSEYEVLVNSFNSRKLTYPEDGLSAFAGVCKMLCGKFEGGMISGIPELFFDLCLLWRPLRRIGPAQRRIARITDSNHVLPSWSWIGWITEVTWPYTWSRTADVTAPYPALLGDLKPFYQIKFEHSNGSRRPVRNNWMSFAMSTTQLDVVPGHLLRHVETEELGQYGLKEQVQCYADAADPSVEHWFPIPTCTTTNEVPKNSKFIHFSTTRGLFRLGEMRRNMTRIYTTDGEAAGTLWQHDEMDKDLIEATTGMVDDRQSIELVAILGNTVPVDDFLVWETPSLSIAEIANLDADIAGTKDIYNVLWIVWRDGVASRKASGEVDRLIWEKHARELVEVTLG